MRVSVNYTNNDEYLTIDILNRRNVLASYKIKNIENKQELFEAKKKIYIEFCRKNQNISAKDILLGFAKVDEEMSELYKKTFPRGGPREGSGRKTDDPKTERYTARCTKEEKEKLDLYLKQLRNQ